MALPDFVIIGAMKCGTSTLAAQLGAQPGVFMSEPKEPNFFSDDDVHARGLGWYESLFDAAAPGDLKGEASTHYAKRPTYPRCVERLAARLPEARLIYVVRDPFDRLVSHYVHGWTMGEMTGGLAEAVERHPELVDYGRYAWQLEPWLERFGRERLHVASLERIKAAPAAELARIADFLGAKEPFVWRPDLERVNASAERVRRFPFYDVLVKHPAAAALRRNLVPKAVRERIRARFQMRGRPELSPDVQARLEPVFAADRVELETLFPELRRSPAPA